MDRAIRALTGAPPELLLATSDKVNPDYRDIVAGFATGEPFTIYDCRPDGDSPRAVPWLRVARGGRFHFGTGEGVGLERPARWE